MTQLRAVALCALCLTILSVCNLPVASAGTGSLDFEDLDPNQFYDRDPNTPQADSFVTGGVPVHLTDFLRGDIGGGPPRLITNGDAYVIDSSYYPLPFPVGSGYFLFTGRSNLVFDFGGPVSEVRFEYDDGYLSPNLEVNGERVVPLYMEDLPATIGGASVVVDGQEEPGESFGEVTISGLINSFSVGGVELWIDNVSYTMVPEPATAVLASIASMSLIFARPRRRWRERKASGKDRPGGQPS